MDGSLGDLIYKKKRFEEKEAKKIFYQISVALLKSLRNNKILHRNIKPGNILYRRLKNGEYEFKISDFKIAK